MPAERRAPSSWHVIRAISRRELGLAWKRKLVRLLFLFSTMPPLVLGIFLVIRRIVRESVGMDLPWDPVFQILQVQSGPVALLALGLGSSLVSRDRSEDVLYLYAVRPVSPRIYAAGKMLAVALPAFLLLTLPGILIAVLRQGLMPDEVNTGESLWLVAKVILAALFIAVAYAGVTVGPSALTKRARWALLIAFAFFWLPDVVMQIAWPGEPPAVGPSAAAHDLLEMLLDQGRTGRGWMSAGVLTLYALGGMWITSARVRQEMIP